MVAPQKAGKGKNPQKKKSALHYNYEASIAFCEQIGLLWLGEEFLKDADKEAFELKFTQKQLDAAMRHHLWQTKYLFDPATYKFSGRLLLAFYFLTGIKPKQ